MIGRGISFAFAVAGVCLTSMMCGAQRAAVPPGSASDAAFGTAVPSTRPETQSNHHSPALAIMHKRIDLGFTNLTLSQAVDVLSRTSGLAIALDPSVKSSVKVGLEAQNVPLYHVLEMIVHQPGTGGLMISPKGGGVLLEPYPTHEVNGKKELDMGANPPWSPAWNLQGDRVGIAAEGASRTTTARAFPRVAPGAGPVLSDDSDRPQAITPTTAPVISLDEPVIGHAQGRDSTPVPGTQNPGAVPTRQVEPNQPYYQGGVFPFTGRTQPAILSHWSPPVSACVRTCTDDGAGSRCAGRFSFEREPVGNGDGAERQELCGDRTGPWPQK